MARKRVQGAPGVPPNGSQLLDHPAAPASTDALIKDYLQSGPRPSSACPQGEVADGSSVDWVHIAVGVTVGGALMSLAVFFLLG